MKLMLDIDIQSPPKKITYHDRLLIIGSCFTEHIGGRLHDLKFTTLQNPNGILFDPLSVSNSLDSYISNRQYEKEDLFYLNELWQSWQHHSIYSGIDQQQVLTAINTSQQASHDFLKSASWLVITLGSSFYYSLKQTGAGVANCHRANAAIFNKNLLETDQTVKVLNDSFQRLATFNPSVQIILTISPVRHIRDGVVNNNRSKARLLEAAHQLTELHKNVFYFPAYELVIDVLRDYRFYDIDLVHPNYAATEFVFNKFFENFIEASSQKIINEIRNVVTAFRHKPLQPSTKAHQQFLSTYLQKVNQLKANHPYIDFSSEEEYFAGTLIP